MTLLILLFAIKDTKQFKRLKTPSINDATKQFKRLKTPSITDATRKRRVKCASARLEKFEKNPRMTEYAVFQDKSGFPL